MRNLKLSLFAITLLATFSASYAAKPLLRLPSILSDHMVLQQDAEVRFWGWSTPRSTVKIVAEWSKDTIEVKTTEKAKWEAYIQTPKAGGPYRIEVIGKQKKITIEDVLIGELWLCSGQSNMEWSADIGVLDAREEMPNSANKSIRFFYIEKATADYPQDDCYGYWQVCTPATMKYFSAVGYFFGQGLHQNLGVPVGLINANWGGTAAETWIPAEKIKESSELYSAWKKLKPSSGWDVTPGSTYNAMIHPITKMRISGVIWYQGENNTTNATTYANLQSTLIQSWRENFQTNFPFYYVQIAPYGRYPISFSAALVREQQEKVMSISNNVGMVSVSDRVDDIKNIHPKYKKTVGQRLANWALGETYKQKAPKYKHVTFKEQTIEKNRIRIAFNDAECGLVVEAKNIEALEIAAADGVFYPAIGTLEVNTNSLLVESKKVENPQYVRYAFSNAGIGNVFDKTGLPIAPFRTDSFEFDLTPTPGK